MVLAQSRSDSSADPLANETWATWLVAIVPQHCTAPFAAHHVEFWEWVEEIQPDMKLDEAFVGIWARGGAKSTSAEAAVTKLGAQRRRKYAWYVSGTQDLADQHVENLASMVEGDRFELFYPEMAERMVGKYGNSKGWRRNRLRCGNGFTVDAVGLDRGARGVKVEDQRPDLIVLDDVDDTEDTPETTQKKIRAITRKILPAGSADVVVLAIQNVVHPNSVFARLADDRADFLARRRVSGPIPAVRGLVTEAEQVNGRIRHRVVAGEPTWAGQDLTVAQSQIDEWGFAAFQAEAQHENRVEGALWCREQIEAQRVDPADLNQLVKLAAAIVTSVDPAVTSGPDADDTGIIVVGRAQTGECPICGDTGEMAHAFVFADRTCHLSPHGWGQVAVHAHDEFECVATVVEDNQGGEMASETIANVAPGVKVQRVHAEGSKYARAATIAPLYGDADDRETWEMGCVHHVGTFPELEEQMTTWVLGKASPDRLDALVHGLAHLKLDAPWKRKMRYRDVA